MWASQLPPDLRLVRSDDPTTAGSAVATGYQYQGYDSTSTSASVAVGILEREMPFGDGFLTQKMDKLIGSLVMMTPGDKEAARRFLAEGCWAGMSASDVRAIQKLLNAALQPVQQTAMGLSVEDIRQLTQVKSLMGMRHEPMAETAAQMRDELLASQGISENEQKFRSSLHLIDTQADGVRVLADELLRTGQLTPQSSLKEIAEKSLALVQTRFNYIKEPNDPDGTEQDRWQSIAETMRKGGGDCEDLAMLQASLLMNLMEQMGYSKKEIRDRVFISGGYMSDAAGNQKGHVLVRLQMDDGDLALDATGNSAPSRFDGLNFDVVFEANDWEFNKLQEIDPAFVTSLDVTGSDPDSIVNRINELMALLEIQLQTRIDIPLPKTTYGTAAQDFFGFGTQDVMQREVLVLNADGSSTSEMKDIKSTTEFSFFTLNYDTYTPPDANNWIYSAQIKEDIFLEYINMTRNLTNEILLLYHIGNSYLDFVANEATEIGMSGYDENTKSSMQQVMESGDKYKGKMVGAMNNFLQKSNNYIQQVAQQIFQFVDSNNSTQLQMAQYKIDNWGRESMFTALPSAIVDEMTNALQMMRIAEKVSVTNKMAKIAADNMTSYINYTKGMTESVRLWAEGTSQSEITSEGPMNFGQKIWDEMEGVSGSKSKYMAYLDKIQAQVESIKRKMTTSPTFASTYGLSTANMNQGSLEGDLFGAHGDVSQFVQVNMDQMAKLLQHNAAFQNMVGFALFSQQTLQDAQRDVASQIGGKKSTASSSQIGAVALMALGAELGKQQSSLQSMQSASAVLASQATDLMVLRINYQKETATTIAKAIKLALEIAGSVLGLVLGATAGTATATAYSLLTAAPLLPLALNPLTAAFGAPAYAASLFSAGLVYGGPTGLWTDYYSRNTSNTVSAVLEVAYSVTQLALERESKEVGTTRFIQEGDTFGRDENGASAAGGPLATAESQTNTDIWSDGEREYYTNRTVAKVLTARDFYNMEKNESISVGGGNVASGERNTERTEFIMDQGNGKVLINGFLMGARESDTAMLQGSVYALVGIFQAQRDAMENIMSQMFGVQKASKANAMGEQINRSVGFEQQLISIYKQDSNQRMQALNMLLGEDKRQTDAIKDVSFKVLKSVVTALSWLNMPIPTVIVAAPATVTYNAVAAGLATADVLISTADALYKYELGPYSDNFSDYYDRTLNTEEKAYASELKEAEGTTVSSGEGLTTTEHYERLAVLEKQQLAKMTDYGGGVGEWGGSVGGDSILEFSNGKVGGSQIPFRQVNYELASTVYQDITEITSLRIFYAMIEQALYQQKQNVFRSMFGVASSADPISKMMSLIDTYNSSVLNGTYDSLLTEAGSRATAYNALANNDIAKTIEYTTLGVLALLNVPVLGRLAMTALGYPGGYQSIEQNAKRMQRLAFAVRMTGSAVKMAFGFSLMYNVKGSNPNITSSMATYDEDEKVEPGEKKTDDKKSTITRGAGGQQRVSMAEANRQKTLAQRRERQITLMREISLALADATADAAEDVGGVSSSKSFKGILKIISTFGSADVKQADFSYKALKQQADAYNAGVEKVIEGASSMLQTIMSEVTKDMKAEASDKRKTATKLEGPGKAPTKESSNLRKQAASASMWAKIGDTVNSALAETLVETMLFLMAMRDKQDAYEPFASDRSNADAKVEGDSKADGGDSGGVASTDNLENSLLGLSLMQANISLLTEIQQDRGRLASKMVSSVVSSIKSSLNGALGSAVVGRIEKAQEKQEAEDTAELEDMSSDDLQKLSDKAKGVVGAGAEALKGTEAKDFNNLTKEESKNPAIVRQRDMRQIVSKDGNLNTVKPEDIKEAYTKLKSEEATLTDKKKAKDQGYSSDARKEVRGKIALFEQGFQDQGTAVKDAHAFAMGDTLGQKLGLSEKPDVSSKEKRQILLLAKMGVAGGSAEQMFNKIQENRMKKGQAEGREAAGSQTFAQAKAGMASKDGLASVRKQQFELGKLEASLFLGEAARIDEATLGDGDPGESDPDRRRDNKKEALDKYVKDGSLNAAFDALDEESQIAALVSMGVSEDSAVDMLGNRAFKKELQALNQDMQSVLSGGKVDKLEALSGSDKTSPTVMMNRWNATAARDKYVGADGRLNRNFYDLGKNEQAAALKTMGVSADTATNGTQAYQDEKTASIKAKVAALTAKVGSRLDATDAQLTALRADSQSLTADLDLGQRTFADVAKTAKEKEGVGVSESYIAADGSIQTRTEANIKDSVPLLLSDNTGNKKIVYVDKGQLETLDLADADTQTKLGKLEGLTEGAVVSVSDPAALQGYQGKSAELKALPGKMAELSTAKEKGLGTLRTLGRLSAMGQAREVEALGLESLHREQGASIEDLVLDGAGGAVLAGKIADLTDARPGERHAIRQEMGAVQKSMDSAISGLTPAVQEFLSDQGILDANGVVNPEMRARLAANPAAADALFAAVPGLDPKSAGALKSKVLGEKEQEKLSQLEKRLKGLEDAVLAPGASLSVRENLAASDAASSPDIVRAQLQAQGAAVSQYILTRAEAKENMQPSMMEALSSKGDSVSDFAARMTGGAFGSHRTKKPVYFVNAVFANVSNKDRRQAKKDFKNAARAEAAGLDREAVSDRFQARIDQLTGVESGVRVAKGFVDRYAKALRAKDDNGNDRSDRTKAIEMLVAERDATNSLNKLMSGGKIGDAAAILKNIAAAGPEGQALAAGILRRMAATGSGDNVRALVDAASEVATPNQLRGLGNAIAQATQRDVRFESLIGDKDLGGLYGLSGWHTDKEMLAMSKIPNVIQKRDASKASQKSVLGAGKFKEAVAGSKGFAKAIAGMSVADLGAVGVATAIAGMSVEELKTVGVPKATAGMSVAELNDFVTKKMPGMSAADLKGFVTQAIPGMSVADLRAFAPKALDALKAMLSGQKKFDGGTAISDSGEVKTPAGQSDETKDREAQFKDFETAMSAILKMPDSPAKFSVLSNALKAVNNPKSVGIDAASLLLTGFKGDGAAAADTKTSQKIRDVSGQLISAVAISLQDQIKEEVKGRSPEQAAPLVVQSKDFVAKSEKLLEERLTKSEKEMDTAVQTVLAKLAAINNSDVNPGVEELKSLTLSGLDASFSEASVRSDYFKKLNDAVEGEGTRAQEKMKREAEKKAEPLPVSSSVTALAEIMQKLDKDPVGAGAELEKVKDRVARVVKEAVSQGHVEDVMRVLGKLRQMGQLDLIQDLGTLVAGADDSEKFKQDLIEYDKRVNEGVVKRSEDQENRRAALEVFSAARIGPNTKLLDQMVQGMVDTKQKQVALDKIADRISSGDTTLLEQALTDQVLRQDLAKLVAEGVALDIPSAYKLLDKVAKLNSKESEAFAESLGAYLVVVNRETKTESRKGDVKKIREHLQSLSKEDAGKKQAAAFVTQISNGYGMQLYTVSSAVGRPSTSVSKALDTLVQKGGAQKVQAQTIFRAFALNNPRAAGNLMTEAMRSTTPNLATTLYEGVEKEIPGANGRTLDGLQSLITISLAALESPAMQPLSADLTTLKTKMEADLATLATKKTDSPPVPTAITSHVQVMGDSLGVPEDQKALVGEQLKQGLQTLADKLVTVASEGDLEVLAEVFGKLESNPAGMTESDFGMLNHLASALPPTTAREVRLQLGMAAMLALPEGSDLRADMQDQQVADMIATGQGRMFSSEMVSDMLASNASGKLDALELLLEKHSPSLVLSDDTMSHILDALDDLSADGAQCNRLLESGGDLSFKVKFDRSLSPSMVQSFSAAQNAAGVTLSTDNVDTLRANFSAISTGTGTAVKDAKDQILGMLRSPAQCALLKKEAPALYLSMLSLAVDEEVSSGDMSLSRDMNSVAAYQGGITAHMADPGSINSLDLLQANLVAQFVKGDPMAATALALIGSAATNPADISSLLCSMDDIDSGELANQIQRMAISTVGMPSQDMSALLNAVPALREKAAVGPHIVLRQLAQSVLTKHNRGASFEGELAAMGSHVRLHETAFKKALEKAQPGMTSTEADAKFETCLSSESGLTGMITLLDAQAKTLKKNTPDARNMTAAKQSLSEVRVGELIRNDDENIAGMDRGDATILVDTLRDAKASIMPHLAPQLKSAEAVERLKSLIGQSNHGLGGDMQALRGELMTATGLLNMNDVNIAADIIGAMPPDLAVGTLSNYKDPAMAVAVFKGLGSAQQADILSRMVPSDKARFEA